MEKLISVVLPVYNGEQFLRESIDSVIAQTYKNWELLILDDCSKDGTPEIAKEYAEKDARIFYYRNDTNLKLPGNLNKGFGLSKGEYLTWTSDDNRYHSDAFRKMADELENKPDVGLVYASYQVMSEEGELGQIFSAGPNGGGQILGSNIVGACFMYKREVMETVGEYDTTLFLLEDLDFWQRVFMKFKASAINEVLYYYRWHGGSLTSTKNPKEFGERLERMTLKNRKGFGKLSFAENHSYISALYRSREMQELKNPYAFKYHLLHFIFRVKMKLFRNKD